MLVDTLSIWAAFVVGILIMVVLLRTRLRYTAFAELKPGEAVAAIESEFDVTVIIPARNEERLIGDCIQSLPKGVRVIVVNDGSTDGTAKAAFAAGAEVVNAPPLKRNTLGKPSACFSAASEVKTRYILFVDADTRFQPEFLPTLIGYANAKGLTMISVFLKRVHPNVASALFMPYAYAMYFAGINAKLVHSLSLTHAKYALASGQCILFAADAYEFTGGHRTILTQVLDDIEIGRLAKRHRLKFQIMRGEKLRRARMYESSLDFWRAMQRNTIRLLAYNRSGAVWSVLTALVPLLYVPMLFWIWSDHDEDYAMLTLYLFAGLPFLPLIAWYRNPLVLFVPLVSYLFPLIEITALLRWLIGSSDVWKGRKIAGPNA